MKVRKTKNATPTQIKNLVKNLSKAYPKSYVAIDFQNMVYREGRYSSKFWLDVDFIFHGFIKTWPSLLAKCEKLMKEAKNG